MTAGPAPHLVVGDTYRDILMITWSAVSCNRRCIFETFARNFSNHILSSEQWGTKLGRGGGGTPNPPAPARDSPAARTEIQLNTVLGVGSVRTAARARCLQPLKMPQCRRQ